MNTFHPLPKAVRSGFKGEGLMLVLGLASLLQIALCLQASSKLVPSRATAQAALIGPALGTNAPAAAHLAPAAKAAGFASSPTRG